MARAIAVTSEKALLKQIDCEGKVLVKFTAKWCSPCKVMKPVIKAALKGVKDVKLIEADIEIVGVRAVKKNWSVSSVPILVLFENGKETKRIIGTTDEATIRKMANGKG